MALIDIRNLTFTYPGQSIPALRDVTLAVEAGEFLLLCGVSGSGKSTLLRQLKRELTPYGTHSGSVRYDGQDVDKLGLRRSAGEIGYVTQQPENQAVTDKVWHELAFGLENLGLPTPVIRRRVAEMASFFGIQGWFDRSVAELSGGQLQMLNLAAVMAMQPRVLLLDEPTAQLDPIAAGHFIDTVRKIHRELGVTVILTEHRLEEVFPLADRVGVLEEGRLTGCDTPERTAGRFTAGGHPVFDGFPAAARIFAGAAGTGPCPLSVRDGARWLKANFHAQAPLSPAPGSERPEPAAELRDVWFRYDREGPDVLRGTRLRMYHGRIACLLGGNGTGKTTALGMLAGLRHPQRGQVRFMGKKPTAGAALLPQNPQLLFVRDTVREDLEETAADCGAENRLERVVEEMGLAALLERHPYDLSGGEQQKAAFAKLLLRQPPVLLLDEPTKGLDAHFKAEFAGILRRLARKGAAVLLATHDLEFAAEYADDCLLFFNGEVVSEDPPDRFFAGNRFYTTAACRIAREIFPGAVTCKEVIRRCTAQRKPSA